MLVTCKGNLIDLRKIAAVTEYDKGVGAEYDKGVGAPGPSFTVIFANTSTTLRVSGSHEESAQVQAARTSLCDDWTAFVTFGNLASRAPKPIA